MKYVSFLRQVEPRAKNLFSFIAFHERVCGSWVKCMPSAQASMMTITSEKDLLGLCRTTPFFDILSSFGMVKTGMMKVTSTTWRTLCGMEFVCYFSRLQDEAKMTDLSDNPAVILGDIEWE